jgi:tRNA threonylcarbamoyladenosine biosynthesis protein TsaB
VHIVAEFVLNVDSAHSERLLWGIHQVAESARWKMEEVDIFGVGIGPGSFTGLRIGVTTARTLSHALQKPLVGVSSLAVLIRPLALHFSQSSDLSETVVIVATDACKGELFALWGSAHAVIQCVVMPDSPGTGLWAEGVYEQVIEPGQLMEFIEKTGKKWIAIGEGTQRYLDQWGRLPLEKKLNAPFICCNSIQGRFLALLVWQAIRANLATDALRVYPRYLRVSDAEKKLKSSMIL